MNNKTTLSLTTWIKRKEGWTLGDLAASTGVMLTYSDADLQLGNQTQRNQTETKVGPDDGLAVPRAHL